MSGRAFAPRLGRSLSAPALPSCGGHAHLSSLCESSRCSHTWDSTNYEYKNGFSDTNYCFGIDTSPALARIVAPALVGASAGVCNVGCEAVPPSLSLFAQVDLTDDSLEHIVPFIGTLVLLCWNVRSLWANDLPDTALAALGMATSHMICMFVETHSNPARAASLRMLWPTSVHMFWSHHNAHTGGIFCVLSLTCFSSGAWWRLCF